MKKMLFGWLLMCLSVSVVFAQDECPVLVQTVLDSVSDACANVGRNQACYGNVELSAGMRPDVTDISFTAPGDITDLANVQSLTLLPMDVDSATWGVALMQVQANLPDTLPGQNVTMLLFGDVSIENRGFSAEERTVLTGSLTSNANVRADPSTTGQVVASMRSGDTVTAAGRLEDNSWLLIASGASYAWVFADLVSLDGEVDDLPVVSTDNPQPPQYGLMQAFYFRSAVGDSACSEAPDSGILIQTPAGAGRVTLNVNGATIVLGSTAYLQAGDGVMTVSLIEGYASVTTEAGSQTVPTGTISSIELDENGLAVGAPSAPEPYATTALSALPTVLLTQTISVPPALASDDISAAVQTLISTNISGEWSMTRTTTSESGLCPSSLAGYSGTFAMTLTLSADGSTLEAGGDTFTASGDNIFVHTRHIESTDTDASNSTLVTRLDYTVTYTFTSPDTFVGSADSYSFGSTNGAATIDCTVTFSDTGTRIGS